MLKARGLGYDPDAKSKDRARASKKRALCLLGATYRPAPSHPHTPSKSRALNRQRGKRKSWDFQFKE